MRVFPSEREMARQHWRLFVGRPRHVGLADDPHDAAVAQRSGGSLRYEVGVEDVVAVRRSLPQAEVDQLPVCVRAPAINGRIGAGWKVTVSLISWQHPALPSR